MSPSFEVFDRCTLEQQAGFAAHLALLAGPDAELPKPLLAPLEAFFIIAGLKPGQSAGERQARIDAFYRRWPVPLELSALLPSPAPDGWRRLGRAVLEGLRGGEHVPSRVTDVEVLFGAKTR